MNPKNKPLMDELADDETYASTNYSERTEPTLNLNEVNLVPSFPEMPTVLSSGMVDDFDDVPDDTPPDNYHYDANAQAQAQAYLASENNVDEVDSSNQVKAEELRRQQEEQARMAAAEELRRQQEERARMAAAEELRRQQEEQARMAAAEEQARLATQNTSAVSNDSDLFDPPVDNIENESITHSLGSISAMDNEELSQPNASSADVQGAKNIKPKMSLAKKILIGLGVFSGVCVGALGLLYYVGSTADMPSNIKDTAPLVTYPKAQRKVLKQPEPEVETEMTQQADKPENSQQEKNENTNKVVAVSKMENSTSSVVEENKPNDLFINEKLDQTDKVVATSKPNSSDENAPTTPSYEEITKQQVLALQNKVDGLEKRNTDLLAENNSLKKEIARLNEIEQTRKQSKPRKVRAVTTKTNIQPHLPYTNAQVNARAEMNVPDLTPISDMETKLLSAIDGKAVTVTSDGKEVQRQVGDIMPIYGRIEKIDSSGCIIANGKKVQIQGANCN